MNQQPQGIPEWHPPLHPTRCYDVVVCGGGPAGCAAALAAVRRGLDTLLVEGQGQLGGMGTSGLAWIIHAKSEMALRKRHNMLLSNALHI